MTLSFKTEINGKPTQFVEKIWQGLLTSDLGLVLWDISNYVFQSPRVVGQYAIGSLPPKLHTIRKDEKDR